MNGWCGPNVFHYPNEWPKFMIAEWKLCLYVFWRLNSNKKFIANRAMEYKKIAPRPARKLGQTFGLQKYGRSNKWMGILFLSYIYRLRNTEKKTTDNSNDRHTDRPTILTTHIYWTDQQCLNYVRVVKVIVKCAQCSWFVLFCFPFHWNFYGTTSRLLGSC